MKKTTVTVKPTDIDRKWYVVDAKGKILGRLASEIAKRLQGKNHPEYMPNMDLGDYIIVINATEIKVTGKKEDQKVYHHHSGYPGGIKTVPYKRMAAKNPGKIIEEAVRGMLPKGPLGRQMFRKMKVFSGQVHCHEAQKPEILDIET
jgi:large subunit ribosomal protein L13